MAKVAPCTRQKNQGLVLPPPSPDPHPLMRTTRRARPSQRRGDNAAGTGFDSFRAHRLLELHVSVTTDYLWVFSHVGLHPVFKVVSRSPQAFFTPPVGSSVLFSRRPHWVKTFRSFIVATWAHSRCSIPRRPFSGLVCRSPIDGTEATLVARRASAINNMICAKRSNNGLPNKCVRMKVSKVTKTQGTAGWFGERRPCHRNDCFQETPRCAR